MVQLMQIKNTQQPGGEKEEKTSRKTLINLLRRLHNPKPIRVKSQISNARRSNSLTRIARGVT